MSDFVDKAIGCLYQIGTAVDSGLLESELVSVEREFGFHFNDVHREFVSRVLPVGTGWPDWRHGNPDTLKEAVSWPIDGTLYDIENNNFWPRSWGAKPNDPKIARRVATSELASIPQLVPLFGHRYLVAGSGWAPSPIFSVYQTDVVFYGDNLVDYFSLEFQVGIRYPSKREYVPFWSDLAEGLELEEM